MKYRNYNLQDGSCALKKGSCGYEGISSCHEHELEYIHCRKDEEEGMLPSYTKHYSVLKLFTTLGLRLRFPQDYAVAAAASSATCPACCSVQIRLRSPYTLSTRPEHSND
jgi:hypothetical protein